MLSTGRVPSLDFRLLCRHEGRKKEVVQKSHGFDYGREGKRRDVKVHHLMDRGGVDGDIADSHGTMGHVIAIKNK